MRRVFADTSFLIALLSPRVQNHYSAARLSAQSRLQIVTTEFVLIEMANAFAGAENRLRAVAFWNSMLDDPANDIVPASSALLGRGFDLFVRRSDKQWSLTDCTSFVVMQEHGLTEALTADRHFEQAGFSALLLS